MPASKPFIIALALAAATGVSLLFSAPHAQTAEAQDAMPLSTKLTPAMIDYFALDVALERPAYSAVVTCGAQPACATTDSSTVRFITASGTVVPTYDGAPSTTIEQVWRTHASPSAGVNEKRTRTRWWTKDDRGHVVMNGTDSIVRTDLGAEGRAPSTLRRVHRYTDIRYVVNDPQFVWPITGLVVLDLANSVGSGPSAGPVLASHAAVSFDGSTYAHVLTTNGLAHRVNLSARPLETTMPDR